MKAAPVAAVATALLLFSTLDASSQNVAIEGTEKLYLKCLDYQKVMRERRESPAALQASALGCVSAVVAMSTMLNDLSRQGLLRGAKVCSNHISPMQAVDIYVLWLQKNPKHMSGFASDSYTSAMFENFLCDKHPWER